MASSKQDFTVVGFQYEPEKPDSDVTSRLDFDDGYDYDADEEIEGLDKRTASSVNTWCHCGHCKLMPSEKECVCCTEIDAIKYFHLNGKSYITINA